MDDDPEEEAQNINDHMAFHALDLFPGVIARVLSPRVDLAVQRKAAVAEQMVYWNPALKAMEPLAYTRCGAAVFAVAFPDDRVEPACHAVSGFPGIVQSQLGVMDEGTENGVKRPIQALVGRWRKNATSDIRFYWSIPS